MKPTEKQTDARGAHSLRRIICPTEIEKHMEAKGLPVKRRYASGWCEGEYFCIQVAAGETLAQLKKHFITTVGHDEIKVEKWAWK
jgi:hypothetical protein